MSAHSTSSRIRYKRLHCVNLPKHRVGTDGSLWSCAKKWKSGKWRRIKAGPWGRGYVTITLTYKMANYMHHVHHLVLLAFVGPCPPGMECRHLNGIKHDNRLENLCWGTPEENAQDKITHGTDMRGTKNHKAKLTEDKVREIRKLYATGKYSQEALSKVFGTRQDNISCIVRRTTWKHVE